MDRIYVQTNDAERNEVVVFDRYADGTVMPLARFDTGGQGTGVPHLASQSSLALNGDGTVLLVANAGSDHLSLFGVDDLGLRLEECVSTGGSMPTSVAVHGELAYVVNAGGEGGIIGFSLAGGVLTRLESSARQLSAPGADPAQIAFSPDGRTLVVTERGTNAISAYAVDERGFAAGPQTIPSSGATPYGFDFADGAVIVTEAFGGEKGAAAASSYALADGRLAPVSASVARRTQSRLCSHGS